MTDTVEKSDEVPRFEHRDAMLVAGLGERYRFEAVGDIPALWQRLDARVGSVPGRIGEIFYGVCGSYDASSFEYVAGVEVDDLQIVPSDFAKMDIPAQDYAVFTHRGHISAFPATVRRVWQERLPALGLTPLHTPNFERYGPEFDPHSGNGSVEIWIPVKR